MVQHSRKARFHETVRLLKAGFIQKKIKCSKPAAGKSMQRRQGKRMSDYYFMKAKIFMGENSCRRICDFDISRALLICDPFLKDSDVLKYAIGNLKNNQIEVHLFADITPDPDVSLVRKVLRESVDFRPDAIIAVGGGSSIDTAKAVSYLYATLPGVDKKPCTIALPTTSGTGSELTSAAVITDHAAGVKYPLIDEDMLPDAVFLDPKLTESVPPKVTADTGMDVLTHAIEAYASVNANDFTDAGAQKAAMMVFRYLEKCVRNGHDMDARTHMQNASALAGTAFNIASVGICHSMAHALGQRFHLPHGRCCGVFLPFVVEYNAGLELPETTAPLLRYAQFASDLGIREDTPEASVRHLVRHIRALMTNTGIPVHFRELGIQADEYISEIDTMAEKAMRDSCTASNPRHPSKEDIAALYYSFYRY